MYLMKKVVLRCDLRSTRKSQDISRERLICLRIDDLNCLPQRIVGITRIKVCRKVAIQVSGGRQEGAGCPANVSESSALISKEPECAVAAIVKFWYDNGTSE